MFADYVFEKSSAAYSNKILLIDAENLLSATDCCTLFSAHGFQVIHFNDDLTFRIQHDDVIQGIIFRMIFTSVSAALKYRSQTCFLCLIPLHLRMREIST